MLLYIYNSKIISSINKTIMNLVIKVSRFFCDLQVNSLITKIYIFFYKALIINSKRLRIGKFSSGIVNVEENSPFPKRLQLIKQAF